VRTSFIAALSDLAERDDRIFLICGDLGFSVLEEFADRFPDRYLNAGVAEQNMSGVAAGLAMSGYVVFTYSIANFPVMRCLEQIRNDICYHNLDVTIVSVGGGYAYGAQGYTHHGLEDLAVMRVMPNITVVAPGDPVETRLATKRLIERGGPAYLRLGKAGEPVVHETEPEFTIGRAIRLLEGSEVTVLSTGGMLHTARQATVRLNEKGVSAGLLSVPTVQPLDIPAVRDAAERSSLLVTVEEHGHGGLASVVAEAIAGRDACPLLPLRVIGKPNPHAGSQEELRGSRGLSADGIVAAVIESLTKRDPSPATTG
jgi:transketolase